MAEETGVSTPSPPSLQEICEKKTLEQILDPSFAATEFTALEPRFQDILFNGLRRETIRLREIEGKWAHLRKRCPRLDTDIYFYPGRLKYPHEENDQEVGEEDGSQNGYNVIRTVQIMWSYVNKYSVDGEEEEGAGANEGHLPIRSRNTRTTYWNSHYILYDPSDLCPGFRVLDPAHKFTWEDMQNYFFSRISSQLLLYRLTIVFGMPPPRDLDGFKSCWMVNLKHHDRMSILHFKDYKGSASVEFDGTSDASVDALRLLNFLVGMSCPHPYGGTLAGTQA